MGEYNRSEIVIRNLENLLLEKECLDFTVQVEDFEFRVHRAVLAASSRFFKECLRPYKKEAIDGCVTLKGMSVSTFEHILNSLYTGKVSLTLDNFIDMWEAADQLQIEFMVQDCEHFVLKVLSEENFIPIWKLAGKLMKWEILNVCEEKALDVLSLDNFENIFKTALEVCSTYVVHACKSFMLNNFEGVSKMVTIMKLPFEEFLSLIRSRDLDVSTEDTVLETVINWVEYVPEDDSIENAMKSMALICEDSDSDNSDSYDSDTSCDRDISDDNADCINVASCGNAGENNTLHDAIKGNYSNSSIEGLKELSNTPETNTRISQLTNLLESVRTSLVSTPLLEYFRNHQLIVNTNLARELIMNAILYKTTHYNHGQWRTSAIHRACSELDHCGVLRNGNKFFIITAFDGEIYTCVKDNEYPIDNALVVFDSHLYAAGVKFQYKANSSLCVFSGNSWNTIAEIPGRQLILVPYDQCIFILSKTSTEIYQIFPKERSVKVEKFTKLPNTIKVQQAISFKRTILIFSSLKVNGEEKTVVHQLDILTKQITELKQLNGPAEHLISFSDDDNIYLLQTSGDLWAVQCLAKYVTFPLLGKLWSTIRKLYGALTYSGKLIILGEDLNDNASYELKAYFNEISYFRFDSPCSNFIPIILPKNSMLPYEQK